MRKLLVLFFVLQFIGNLSAQQIQQNVTNASGSVFQADNLTITFSVGEPIISTLMNNNHLLSQGFIQPIKTDLPTSLLHFANLDASFTTYPNPVTEGVTVEFTDNSIIPLKYEVYSSDGRLVLNILESKSYINLSALSNGIYWLRPIVLGKDFSVKKIIKNQ